MLSKGHKNMEQLNDKRSDTKTTPISKTRQVQIDKIMQFVKGSLKTSCSEKIAKHLDGFLNIAENNEQIIGKVAYDNLWDTLTTDLNSLGPPTNTTKKWRQVWSSYKYNNKKRLAGLIASAGHQGMF